MKPESIIGNVLCTLFLLIFLLAISPAFAAAIGDSAVSLDPSKIRISLLNQDPDPVEPGEIVDTRWKIENYGAGKISNMEVKIEPEYPLSFTPGENQIKNLGTIEARQIGKTSYVLSWKLKVDENAPEGSYVLPVIYSMGNAEVKNEEAQIKVKTRESLVIIDTIEVIPERPKSGEEAEVIVNLKNLADSTIDNVQVQLKLNASDFATIGGTSEKAFKNMMPKAAQKVSFRIVVNPGTPSKIHNIPLIVKFTDFENKNYSVESNFGLLVENPPEYSINLDETTIYKNSQRGKAVISFSNIGKSDINFVTMELTDSEDYEILSAKKVYLGNLESDDYESAEFQIYTSSRKKEIPLKIRISYKDSFNKNHEETEIIPLKIYSLLEAKKYGLSTGKSTGIIIFALILAGIAVVVYKIRKKITFKKMLVDFLNKLTRLLGKEKKGNE